MSSQHNHKHCKFFHSLKDRRRKGALHSPELCKYQETDECPFGDACRLAHNKVERLYHPEKYKAKFCTFFPQNLASCEYGGFCSFAHSQEEIKVSLIHKLPHDPDFYLYYFKTEWCPFTQEHNKAQCVYAHNWQDFRRKPHVFLYQDEMCLNWKSGTFISEYHEGCPHQQECQFCHGWKERDYHPLNYKTRPCAEKKLCPKGLECPFFHSVRERRDVGRINFFRPRVYHMPAPASVCNNINTQKELELFA